MPAVKFVVHDPVAAAVAAAAVAAVAAAAAAAAVAVIVAVIVVATVTCSVYGLAGSAYASLQQDEPVNTVSGAFYMQVLLFRCHLRCFRIRPVHIVAQMAKHAFLGLEDGVAYGYKAFP